MDSLALRAVYSADSPATGLRPRGTDHPLLADHSAEAIPRRGDGARPAERHTGEGRTIMDERYDERYTGSSGEESGAEDEARRAVQVAMDRRDNGGRS